MTAEMTADAFQARTFDEPDERMTFAHGHMDIIHSGARRLRRVTFEPGFRWSVDMAPGAGTARCQLRHLLWILSGRMSIHLTDGRSVDVAPGQLVSLAPDHDSWTLGDEPVVFLDIDPIAPG